MTQGMRSPARVLGEWRAAIARLDALPAGAPEADAAERVVEALRLEYQRASLAWLDAEEEAEAASGIAGSTLRVDLERLARELAAREAHVAGEAHVAREALMAREARERDVHRRDDRDVRRRVDDDRGRILEGRPGTRRAAEAVRILAPR